MGRHSSSGGRFNTAHSHENTGTEKPNAPRPAPRPVPLRSPIPGKSPKHVIVILPVTKNTKTNNFWHSYIFYLLLIILAIIIGGVIIYYTLLLTKSTFDSFE